MLKPVKFDLLDVRAVLQKDCTQSWIKVSKAYTHRPGIRPPYRNTKSIKSTDHPFGNTLNGNENLRCGQKDIDECNYRCEGGDLQCRLSLINAVNGELDESSDNKALILL